MFFSGSWFTNEFHDLADYYFGSHGRFGCQDEHYDTYIFRDTTAPWILHGPVLPLFWPIGPTAARSYGQGCAQLSDGGAQPTNHERPDVRTYYQRLLEVECF